MAKIKITEKLVVTEKESEKVIRTFEVIDPFVANVNAKKIVGAKGDQLELTDFEYSIVKSKVKEV